MIGILESKNKKQNSTLPTGGYFPEDGTLILEDQIFVDSGFQTDILPPIGNNARTFSMWVKPVLPLTTYNTILEYGSLGNGTIFLLGINYSSSVSSSNKDRLQGGIGGGNGVLGTNRISDAQLQHLVFSHDGSNTMSGLKLYLNKTLEASGDGLTGVLQGSSSSVINTGSEYNLAIGEDVVLQIGRYFKGQIKQFVMWDRELSLEEIKSITI